MEETVRAFFESLPTVKQYKPGELILRQGEPATEFCYLKSGLVQGLVITPDGHERIVLFSPAHRVFGAASFFTEALRQTTVEAVQRSTVVFVGESDLQRGLSEIEEFAASMFRELSLDILDSFSETVSSMLLTADLRVARFIFRHMKKTKAKDIYEFPYSQVFIARTLGLSRWSVNRSIQAFKAHGWLDSQYGRCIIKESEKLYNFCFGEK